MGNNMSNDLHSIDDKELLSETKTLRKKEQELLLEILLYIAEVDTRKLYREAAYPSMFAYLQSGLGYSGGGAYRRLQVARAIRRCSELYGALKREEISFSAAVELSKAEDILDLLPLCLGKTGKEVERLVQDLIFSQNTSKSTVSPRKKEQIRKVRVKKSG